jgi:tyrosinase
MTVRKDASSLTPVEQQRYVTGVTHLIGNGIYGQLVAIHADMSHLQHGSMGPVGTERFLPWHRDFLLKFERALKDLDPQAFVPYWRWTKDRAVPSWLASVLPTVAVPGIRRPLHVRRSLGRHGRLPSSFEVNPLITQTNLTYTDFTTALEGFHNDVHNWVGGTMSNIMVSPADPVFWLHHAQVDRLWSMWQNQNPGKQSTLPAPEDVLDPWPENVNQVQAVSQLGYSYQ